MTNEFLKWAIFAHEPAIGARTLHKLRLNFKSADQALGASYAQFKNVGFDDKTCGYLLKQQGSNLAEIETILQQSDIKFIWFDDPEYPEILKNIPDPPACLYRRGAPLTPLSPALAVVGSRHATPYGKQVTNELVKDLALSGITIVSGLAFGIDASAHRATLEINGKTIAVLANGVDKFYPSNHRALALDILNHEGTIISESPPGTPALHYLFPVRNRIIAGLSLGTLVIEAAEQSGSLITACSAIESGREVFAVPGPITSDVSAGPHGLIKMGAKLVTEADDIISELRLESLKVESEAVKIIPDSPSEAAILTHLSREPIHLDELIRASELDPATVSGTLLMMEMKGRARNLGANRYVVGR